MSEINPDPDQVAAWRPKLANQPPAYIAGVLSGWVRSAARDHSQHCPGCDLCQDFVYALSVIAAFELEHAADPSTIGRLRWPEEDQQ